MLKLIAAENKTLVNVVCLSFGEKGNRNMWVVWEFGSKDKNFFLPYMSIATPAFILFLFALNIFLNLLTFSLYVSLYLKWVSFREHIDRSCFCIDSAHLCLSVGAFSLFTFKIIICIYLFIYCHFLNCFEFVDVDIGLFSSLTLLLSSLVIWWLSLVCFGLLFLFF